jgi:hypothetical protein
MKISKDNLLKITKVAKISGERPVIFDGSKVSCYGEFFTVESRIDPIHDQKFSLSGDRILSSLSTFDADGTEVEIRVKDDAIVFAHGNTKRKMSILSESEMIKIELVGGLESFQFSKDGCSAQRLVSAIKNAKPFSGNEKLNRDFVFVKFDGSGISIYATDGNTFYIERIRTECKSNFTMALTPDHCKLIFDMIESGNNAIIGVDSKKRIAIRTAFGFAVSVPSSSEHADYLALIDLRFAVNTNLEPKVGSACFEVNASSFKNSVARCSKVFTSEADFERPIKIRCDSGKMEVYASSTKFNDTIQDFIKCNNTSYEAKFYVFNLIKSLAVASDEAKFYFTSGVSQYNQPICILSENSCVYVGPITER